MTAATHQVKRTTTRKCLRCKRSFPSAGSNNRLCGRCNVANLDPKAKYFEVRGRDLTEEKQKPLDQ